MNLDCVKQSYHSDQQYKLFLNYRNLLLNSIRKSLKLYNNWIDNSDDDVESTYLFVDQIVVD